MLIIRLKEQILEKAEYKIDIISGIVITIKRFVTL